MELADRPDLAPVRDRGQRQSSEGGWVENFRCGFLKMTSQTLNGFFVLGYITTSMVLVSPSVKICDFLFFFLFFFLHCWRVRLVRAVSKTVQGVRKIGNLPQGSSFLSTRKSAMYLHFLVSFFFLFFFYFILFFLLLKMFS